MERLLDYFEPENYRLETSIWRETEKTQGEVQILGRLQPGKSCVKLHAVGLEIDAVKCCTLLGAEVDYEQLDYTACEFKIHDDILEIALDSEILSALTAQQDHHRLVLKVAFHGQLNRNMQGCYLSTYDYNGEKQRLVATQFESHYAREAFPCIDEPAAKATFELSLTISDYDPSRDVVLANTPLVSQADDKFTFAPTPRMSTYLLAWVFGPLKSVSTVNQHGIKVSSYCALNQSLDSLLFANKTAARALDYYDDKFDTPYPLAKLDQVALPDFEAGAMENWGLVTYRESCLLADDSSSLEAKKSVAITVTHELSHQWFGDLVTMQWWDDLWLNESFASVMEYYATDALYPEFNIWQDFFTGDCLAALRRDALPGVQSVQQAVHHPAEIATLFDGAIVYAKGARLILMLIRLIGTDNFDRALHSYFEQHQYQNTVGDDLWQALHPYADFDVKAFMHAWISQPGYPALRRASTDDHSDWQQQRFLLDGSTDDSKWPLPEVKFDMSGHYLIAWSDSEFREQLADFSELSSEAQLRLLIDRMLLAKANLVPSTSLLELLQEFTAETSASVWKILTTIIGDLKLFCPPETPAAADYHAFLRQTFAQRLASIELDLPQADTNTIEVRDMLLSIAYYVEDETILRSLAERYCPDFAQLDSEIRIYVLAAQMFFAEDATFAHLLARYPEIHDPEIKSDILYCLALARRPENLAQLLSLLDQPAIVRPQDHIFLYIYLLRNFRTREQTLDWLISHWDYVKTLTGDKSIEDYPRYAAGVLRTAAEAQKFSDFFDQFRDDAVLSRTLKIAHVEIDARLQLIRTQTPAVQAKLRDLLGAKKN